MVTEKEFPETTPILLLFWLRNPQMQQKKIVANENERLSVQNYKSFFTS